MVAGISPRRRAGETTLRWRAAGTETAAGNDSCDHHAIYRRTDANQRKVPAGDYSDQILVTVEF